MMQLPESNPQPPEGINNRHESVLTDFLLLAGALLALVLLASWLIGQSASWLGPRIPFGWEPSMTPDTRLLSEQDIQTADYLNALATRLLQDQPDALPVTVHWLPDTPEANAAATTGGHIVVTSGLLDSVHSENGLAMVLAHEIVHIQDRHPAILMLEQLGHSLLYLVLGMSDSGAGWLAQSGGNAALMTFSRSMEATADRKALQLLQDCYGHTVGADEFFLSVLSDNDDQHLQTVAGLGGLFASHPDTEDRLRQITASIAGNSGDLTPLPAWLLSASDQP